MSLMMPDTHKKLESIKPSILKRVLVQGMEFVDGQIKRSLHECVALRHLLLPGNSKLGVNWILQFKTGQSHASLLK